MNCFNHNDTEALGTCKHCNKGICKSCLTDTGDGLACTATCVEQVEMLNSLVRKNQRIHKTTTGAGNSAALLYISIGSLSLLTTLLWLKRLDPFLIGFGIVCIVYGIYIMIRTRSLREQNNDF